MTDMHDQPDRDDWPPGPAPWPASAPGQPASGYRPGGYGPGGPAGPDLVEQGPRRRPRRSFAVYLLVAVLAAGIGAASVWLGHNGTPAAAHASGQLGPGTSTVAVSSARERAVAAAVRPGLVDITSRLGYQGGTAAATGMIISPGGLVLTNNHVIAASTELTAVMVSTQRHFAVRWLGYDKADDVALLQLVGASGLRTVPLGNSARARTGERVVALGNAEGLGGAPAVAGVITRTDQTVTASDDGGTSSETLHNMLETDAAIVPGDSGGSLVSASGRVIGMDTAAATGPGGGGHDAGFAIPINRALAIARQIIAGRAGARIHIGSTGFLGVLIPSQRASQLASPASQRRHQLQQYAGGAAPIAGAGCISTNQTAGVPPSVAPASAGALILGRLCGTPADRAGIKAGDVITKVDSQSVTTPSSLTNVMQHYRAGARAAVTWVDLSGRKRTATLVLGQAPPQ